MKKKATGRLDFLSPLSLVPGFGPQRVAALQESGLQTIGDLLYHFPRSYIDRSTIVPMRELDRCVGGICTCIGTITQLRVEPGRKKRLRIQVADETGTCEALWFQGIPFFQRSLVKGKRIVLHGRVQQYHTFQMVHPHTEAIDENASVPAVLYLPQYSLTTPMREHGVMQKALFSAIRWILKNLKHYPKILPEKIEKKKGFPSLAECLAQIHMPENLQTMDNYYSRLRYEELYQLCLTLRWSRRKFALPGRSLVPGNLPELLRAQIPFTLTEEQEKAVSILYADSASSRRMHRLLQGDVGSGKTIVGLFACLPALNHGLQVAWLAPTEILAQQTFTRLGGWLEKMHVSNVLLTGSLVSAKKKEIAADLRLGKILFVVGTHALIQESVSFSQLGMIVIDEQHRFGSQQRLSIQQKDPAADFLLMSATPIPQTLAKTVYGDLDIVTIPSLPARRNPVSTHVVPEEKRSAMDLFVKKELMENGSQAFYVVPRIDSVTDEIKGMKDIETVMKDLERGVLSAVPRAAIHGKIDAEEKERIMRRFAAGEIRLLVATTVVEVGIDVPNATVMIIEHADRFGLSQLHQLRGRVGRGPKKGYAFLLSTIADTEQAHKRLKKFCAVHDGFEIAELDLALRGPGEVSGFRQSGWDELQIADILRDADLFREIQEELDMLLMP